MTDAPGWATELMNRVLEDEGCDSVGVTLTWRRSSQRWGTVTYSSGRTHPIEQRIIVTAGKDRRDQKLVLLHELAHVIGPPKASHDAQFWDTAWRFYDKYGVPFRYAIDREASYRAESVKAARRAGHRVSEQKERAAARTRR